MSKIIYAAGGLLGATVTLLALYGLFELSTTISSNRRSRTPPPLARASGSLVTP